MTQNFLSCDRDQDFMMPPSIAETHADPRPSGQLVRRRQANNDRAVGGRQLPVGRCTERSFTLGFTWLRETAPS